MIFERFARHVGRERIVRIGEVGQRERHRLAPHRRVLALTFRAGLYPLAVRCIVAARLAGPAVVLFAECAGGRGGVADQLWGRVGSRLWIVGEQSQSSAFRRQFHTLGSCAANADVVRVLVPGKRPKGAGGKDPRARPEPTPAGSPPSCCMSRCRGRGIAPNPCGGGQSALYSRHGPDLPCPSDHR